MDITPALGGTIIPLWQSYWVKTENNHLFLAFAPNTQIKTEQLKDITAVIAQNTKMHDIQTVEWNDTMQTASRTYTQMDKQARKKAVDILNKDVSAQKIAQFFGGQWLPEQVELKNFRHRSH